jgi:hypothetical protein
MVLSLILGSANLMLCLDIQMANNILLYLMPFPSLSVNRSCEKFNKSKY